MTLKILLSITIIVGSNLNKCVTKIDKRNQEDIKSTAGNQKQKKLANVHFHCQHHERNTTVEKTPAHCLGIYFNFLTG